MPLLRLIILLLFFAIPDAWAQQPLPSESMLPRDNIRRQELPGESELPLAMQHRPLAQLVATTTTPLPDESQLPPAIDQAEIDPPGPLPLKGSPDGIPWLRLNPNGSTAPIRAIEFSPDGGRVFAAGDDKSAISWLRGNGNNAQWQYERTIRWQVQRGTRGRIYALASTTDLLAMAGEGAMVGTGEIVVVDPASGDFRATLFDEAEGHRQVVVGLDAVQTPRGPVIASLSMDGRALLWTRNTQGVWQSAVARKDDIAESNTPDQAQRLLGSRVFSGIVAVDQRHVIVPVATIDKSQSLSWHLQQINVTDNSRQWLGGSASPNHQQFVTAMASDAKRQRLVSADGQKNVFVWDLRANPAKVQKLNRPGGGFVLDVTLSDDGNTLAIGTAIDEQSKQAIVEVWDLSRPGQNKSITSFKSAAHVLACQLSPQGDAVTYAAGDALVVQPLSKVARNQILRGSIEVPLRVAFAKEEPYFRIGIGTFRIGIGTQAGGKATIAIDRIFDTDQLRLTRTNNNDNSDWLPTNWGQGDWKVTESTNVTGRREWWLSEGEVRRARLPLAEEKTGVFRSACWVPGDDLEMPKMVAIGTSSGDILLCQVAMEGSAQVVRRLRGHASDINSLAISRDLQWLVSASADATVRIWPIGRAESASNSANRWGASFGVDGDRLLVNSIRPDGPLHFRSAREGDEITRCRWSVSGEQHETTDADEIKRTLEQVEWDQAIEFEIRTGRQATRSFQLLPAWQQLVSLVINDRGEWAYWAPSGYYDASFEGHRLFGWQINRGLDELPDYFLAAQFRGVLEKPDVMSRLLREGSLEQAFKAAQSEPPIDAAQTVAHTYRLKPEVSIVAPTPGIRLGESGQPTVLRARIRVPAGQSIVAPKAFANGVVAPPGQMTGTITDNGESVYDYEWQMAIPSDPRVLLQVIASTENEITESDELTVENTSLQSDQLPRLYWLAVGVDNYRDPQIPDLRTPVAHTTALVDLIRSQSGRLFRVEATMLSDSRVSRPAWNLLASHRAEQLREHASPDDLLVVYVSGHGVQDLRGEEFYFVTPNAEFGDVMAGGYADCLSFGDFARFSDISCRKLVILDTCHSGAIQPMRHREMRSAIRSLQQDQFLTLAASQGSEEAVEGRFSQRLLEALRGDADRLGGDANGVVSLDEVIAYVQQTVSADSLGDAQWQRPAAGPNHLLPYVAVPLSKVEHAAAFRRSNIGNSHPQPR